MIWFKLAYHFGCPVGELQRRMSSIEFTYWKTYLDEVPNYFNESHYYLAQIAAEVRCGRVKDPDKVKVEDLLIKFQQKDKPRLLTAEEKAASTAATKAVWGARVGVKQDG